MKIKSVVYLALSGGVDSAVAAALLLEQGFEVKAVFLKIWSDKMDGDSQCPWVQDRKDALAVAAKLSIPITTIDFEKEYKEEVFSYFVQEYKAGRTPNPDILCNEVIKFGKFLDYALQDGADYIATGHHVRKKSKNQIYHLLAGKDKEKDQSYFLSSLTQHQLRYSLFPIGDLTKSKVRKMAKKLGLDAVAEKRSTRGICFIGKVDLKKFLEKYTIEEPGNIVDQTGKVIGKHDGVSFYTIGQRKRLHIPAVNPESKPYFVVSKNAEKNQLVVSDDEGALLGDQLYCEPIHWLDGKGRDLPFKCKARIRYNQKLQSAVVSKILIDGIERIKVDFKTPQRAITPGQIAAFYKGKELVGSAVIS